MNTDSQFNCLTSVFTYDSSPFVLSNATPVLPLPSKRFWQQLGLLFKMRPADSLAVLRKTDFTDEARKSLASFLVARAMKRLGIGDKS